MASESEQQHFILFPFMAPGHMNPMIDIAKLLAYQGVIISIITTPINANRFKQTLNRSIDSGLRINLLEVPFPAEKTGLPQDCENFDMLSSLSLADDFFSATNLLQNPVEKLLQEVIPRPTCIISDINLPYTSRVASKLQVPRIVFSGVCCFLVLCLRGIYGSGVLEKVNSESESEYFSVPGLHHHIELTKQQLPMAFSKTIGAFSAEIMEAEKVTCGIIMNTFEELEPEYVQEYQNLRSDYKVWCVGPVSLTNKHNLDMIQRGSGAQESDQCLTWLDEQQPGSVIYACLGSICNLVTSQLIELALGLEASNKPFIWVTKGAEKSPELEKWIEAEGFEKRTSRRSLIIRGWAPQLAILSHVATGGFLTHCGWNSSLEAVSAGVPMVTWPLFGDQFCNEKFVVDVLNVGVKVGAEVTVAWGEEDKVGVTVKKEDVTKAIEKLMDAGDEGEERRRRRAKKLSVKAKRAMEENGSSSLQLKQLIEDMKLQTATTSPA
ncbi:UDP-Glycosyltransferase superfamily protein [Euphorbia peplus]|nr:UDP-Glycosyltransferase superfamily protein [Euphorbia peplus]